MTDFSAKDTRLTLVRAGFFLHSQRYTCFEYVTSPKETGSALGLISH